MVIDNIYSVARCATKSREGFGDVEGAAGAESESGIQRNVSDVAMENTTAGRAGTQNLAAGRTGNFGLEFKSTLETLLARTRIVG